MSEANTPGPRWIERQEFKATKAGPARTAFHVYTEFEPGVSSRLATFADEESAREFAAAPELLAALEELANMVEGTKTERSPAYDIARAAIARARGDK